MPVLHTKKIDYLSLYNEGTMPYYFFVNRTQKQISGFNNNVPILIQFERTIIMRNWPKRDEIIVEADQEFVYHLVDNLGYVLLG